MRVWIVSMLVVVSVMLPGCITIPAPVPHPPAQPVRAEETRQEKIPKSVSDADRLLSYYAYAQSLPKEQLAKELEQTRRFYDSSGSGFARMQLVLLRTTANAEQREPEKILDLLQLQLSVKDDSQAELTALASLIKALLSDNRQLESNLEMQKEKLKEEAKKSEALKQKLEALIEAERKLLERSRPR